MGLMKQSSHDEATLLAKDVYRIIESDIKWLEHLQDLCENKLGYDNRVSLGNVIKNRKQLLKDIFEVL